MKCSKCGKLIPLGDKYCVYCGSTTGFLPVRMLQGLFWRLPTWAKLLLSLTLICVSVATLLLLLQNQTPAPQLMSEPLPMLSEPIIIPLECPTIYSEYVSATIPNIDGIFAADEWAEPAFTETLWYALEGSGKTGTMAGYFINDGDFLYTAITVTAEDFKQSALEKGGAFLTPAIWFDGDNNGIISLGEDIKRFWRDDYSDSHLGTEGWEENDRLDNGKGSYTFSDEYATYTFEFQIPLNSGDPEDLAVEPGDTIGIKVVLKERQTIATEGSSQQTITLGTTGWPTGQDSLDTTTYAKLVLASASFSTTMTPPSPTPAPPSPKPQFTKVWADDFSNTSSGWPIDKVSTTSDYSGYLGSHYYIQIKGARSSVPFTTNNALGEYSDFVVQVDCWVEPDDAAGTYGLRFGQFGDPSHPSQYYNFTVSSTGEYQIDFYLSSSDGRENHFYGSGSPYIKRGGVVNRLMLERSGLEIKAYVNGGLIACLADAAPPKGLVYLFAATGEQGNVRILFDNFLISSPSIE